MRDTGFNYGRLMQRALRGLMADVLGQVAKGGLPGNHHFFISFDTTHAGVDMPDWLLAQYPEELAIVLQHEFSDLAVANDRFSVVLSFNDKPATLVVPYDAIKTFADPSENFGLRFDAGEHDHGDEPPEPSGPDGDEQSATREEPQSAPEGDAEVVSLDAFRKR